MRETRPDDAADERGRGECAGGEEQPRQGGGGEGLPGVEEAPGDQVPGEDRGPAEAGEGAEVGAGRRAAGQRGRDPRGSRGGSAENPEIAVQVQAQLEAVGFVVKQDVREYANLEEEMLNGGFDAVIVSRNTMIDTGDPLSALMQDFSCEGGNNISQLCDPEIDKIFTEGLTFPPGPERQQATMNAEAGVLTQTATIPVTHERVIQGELGTWVGFERDL